jgi:AraC-like DNA-binding protein
MATKDQLFISVTKLYPVLSYLESVGIEKESFCSAADLPSETLRNPDSKISMAKLDDILQTAQLMTNDDFLGLHMGEMLTRPFSHIIGHIMMNCETMVHALNRFCEFQRLLDETTRTTFYKEDDCTVIEAVIRDKSIRVLRQLAEYKLSGAYSYAKLLTAKPIRLIRVDFEHAAPSSQEEYERIFGCRVHFNERRNALAMDSECLNFPIIEPNSILLKILETYAKDMLKSANASDTFTNKTTQLAISMMPGSLPNIKEIAKRQAVSVRKLQMKLKEEGTGYRILLDDIRKAMAIKYLADDTLSIGEIAYLLGFSEPSAFHRAFKRWTERTPETFRMKRGTGRSYQN